MSSSDLLLQMMEEEMVAEEQKPNPQTPLDAVNDLDDMSDDQAANWMSGNVSSFRFSIGSTPKSRTIPKHELEKIAEAVGADASAVKGAVEIFPPSLFPIIKEGDSHIKAFEALISRYAIPKQALVYGFAEKAAEETGALTQVADHEREDGHYLILNDNIEEFEQKYNAILASYMEWGERLSQEYPAIREQDKVRLGDWWPAIKYKYPSQDYIKKQIRVRPFLPTSVNQLLSAAHLPAAIRETITHQFKEQANAEVQGYCEWMTQKLLDAVTLATKQLNRRTRVNPATEDSDYARFQNGEVILFESHEDDRETIPEDFVRVRIQLVKTDENGKQTHKRDSRGRQEIESILISESEFNSRLKPRQQSNDWCKLYDGQIQALKEWGEKIDQFEGLLGAGRSPLKSISDRVQTIINEHGESSGAITANLKGKDNEARRDAVRNQLSEVTSELAQDLLQRGEKKKISKRNLGV